MKMQLPRHQLLAAAGFSLKQHRDVAWAVFLNRFSDLGDALADSDYRPLPLSVGENTLYSSLEPAALDCVTYSQKRFFAFCDLFEVIESAKSSRYD
ncbi:MAG: hypothetical protein NTW07_07240 [candidate division Zixibacteria bacterium]|nr:hypothetical protein [candidate division Zixibacteria bacterium]